MFPPGGRGFQQRLIKPFNHLLLAVKWSLFYKVYLSSVSSPLRSSQSVGTFCTFFSMHVTPDHATSRNAAGTPILYSTPMHAWGA